MNIYFLVFSELFVRIEKDEIPRGWCLSIPIEKIILETDSPYLPPTPYRGKRNESSYIPIIGQKLAEVKNCPIEDIQFQTTRNAIQLFNL